MSAETDYLQRYLDLFDDLWQNPVLRQYNLTLGIEITATGLLARYPYIDLVGRDEATARRVLLAGVAEGRRKPEVAPRFPAHNGAPTFPGRSAEAIGPEDIVDGSRRAQLLLPTQGGCPGGAES